MFIYFVVCFFDWCVSGFLFIVRDGILEIVVFGCLVDEFFDLCGRVEFKGV